MNYCGVIVFYRKKFVFILAMLTSAFAQAQSPQFQVEVSADSVHVEAQYTVHGKTLALFNVQQTEQLPNGQAGFIRNLVVKDADGKPVKFKATEDGDWNLARGNQTVTVSYDVVAEHGNYRWPAGEEEVAYRTNDGLFFTGYALFIVPAEKMDTDISVKFSLPTGWQASTPWRATGDNQFQVYNRRELLVNAMFFGDAHREVLKEGDYELELVLGKNYANSSKLFTEVLRPMLKHSTELFGSAPKRNRYLIIVNEGASGDGGAFEGSFSQLINGPATENNRVVWGYVMAHELFHFWNGVGLAPAAETEEWFKEGVTDYMTSLLLYRHGVFNEQWFHKRLETMYTRYMIGKFYQRANVSLQEAGLDKQNQRALVYGGGALVAIALEAEMRKASNGEAGVAELLRAMYQELALQNKPYTLEDIRRLSKQISGYDPAPLFAEHVSGKGYLSLTEPLKQLGLSLAAFAEEATVTRDAAADELASKIHQKTFGL
ncbi:hypothetical protein E2H98_06450 [Permianibacter aggregans]|nr:hypothetical protein E2H98_06450 [Permianibacter aggregans]